MFAKSFSTRVAQCALAVALCGGVTGSLSGGGLDDLYDQYADLNQATVEASVQAYIFDQASEGEFGVKKLMSGSFDYYVDNSQYRINSHMDPNDYPGMNTDIAFDGTDFQYFERETGVLHITGGEPADGGSVTLPNPLFAPVEFLIPIHEDDPPGPIHIDDVRNATANASASGVTWTPVQLDGRSYERAVFPGSVYYGQDYDYHVLVYNGERHRPRRIERVADDGTVLSRTTLEHYKRIVQSDGTVTYWPQQVKMEAFDPVTNDAFGEKTFQIHTLKINEAVPAGTFTIDWSEAGAVLNDGVVEKNDGTLRCSPLK